MSKAEEAHDRWIEDTQMFNVSLASQFLREMISKLTGIR